MRGICLLKIRDRIARAVTRLSAIVLGHITMLGGRSLVWYPLTLDFASSCSVTLLRDTNYRITYDHAHRMVRRVENHPQPNCQKARHMSGWYKAEGWLKKFGQKSRATSGHSSSRLVLGSFPHEATRWAMTLDLSIVIKQHSFHQQQNP